MSFLDKFKALERLVHQGLYPQHIALLTCSHVSDMPSPINDVESGIMSCNRRRIDRIPKIEASVQRSQRLESLDEVAADRRACIHFASIVKRLIDLYALVGGQGNNS